MEGTIGHEAFDDQWSELDLIEDEEMELAFSNMAPDGETVEGSHTCTIYGPEERAGEFEIECDRCGTIGSAATETEAQTIARLHEELLATLVDNWDIDRAVGTHVATITTDGDGFAIACPQCGDVGSADDRDTAGLLKRFHDSAFELASKAVAS